MKSAIIKLFVFGAGFFAGIVCENSFTPKSLLHNSASARVNRLSEIRGDNDRFTGTIGDDDFHPMDNANSLQTLMLRRFTTSIVQRIALTVIVSHTLLTLYVVAKHAGYLPSSLSIAVFGNPYIIVISATCSAISSWLFAFGTRSSWLLWPSMIAFVLFPPLCLCSVTSDTRELIYYLATATPLLLMISRAAVITKKHLILFLIIIALTVLNVFSFWNISPLDGTWYSLFGFYIFLYPNFEFVFFKHFLISTLLFIFPVLS